MWAASWVSCLSCPPRRRVSGNTAHMEIVYSPCNHCCFFAGRQLGPRESIASIVLARLAKRGRRTGWLTGWLTCHTGLTVDGRRLEAVSRSTGAAVMPTRCAKNVFLAQTGAHLTPNGRRGCAGTYNYRPSSPDGHFHLHCIKDQHARTF